MATALALLVALVAPAAVAGAQAAGPEAAFVQRVTAERAAGGLPALPLDADLVGIARAHSADMAAQSRLFHTVNLGTQVQAWVKVAENVGVGSTVDDVDRALMASPTHRADILDPSFTGMGVGVVDSGGTLWVTQVFRQRAGAAITPAAAPAPAPAAPSVAPAPRPRRPAPAVVRTTTTQPPTTTTSTTTTTTAPPPTTAAPPPVAVRTVAVAASVPMPVSARTGPAALVALVLLLAAGGATARAAGGRRPVGGGAAYSPSET